MAFGNKITTSIFGRRLGINRLTTGESGGNHGAIDFLAGPEHLRATVTTATSTGTNIRAYGVSYLTGTSAGSSVVFTLDPPIPGVDVTIVASTNSATYLKTANSETIFSTQNSSGTTVKGSSVGGCYRLIGLTTAKWGSLGLTSGTSAKAGSFTVSTST